MTRHSMKNLISVIMAIVVCISCVVLPPVSNEAQAKDKVLTLSMAVKAGIAESPKIETLESQKETKEAALEQAIKTIALKKKRMSTFSWSPLLSFKFPTKPDYSKSYEFTYKPISIQYSLDKINHSLNDQLYAVTADIETIYIDIVVLQKQIKFNEQRLKIAEDTLAKSSAKLAIGDATQADINKMKSQKSNLTNKISADKRKLSANLKKLSRKVGFDVSTGFTFEDPFVKSELDRSMLDDLKQHTLDNDQSYYETSLDAIAAKVSLQTSYNLISSQYSSKYVSMISGYVNQILAGQDVNTRAFKKSYKDFIVRIDENWKGKKRIIFFKFPKVWFKGSLDGDYYIEDEPYALYEGALAYQEARKAQEEAKADLEQQVEDAFNNYIEVRNSYQAYESQVSDSNGELEKARILNLAGDLTYEEYAAAQKEYEDLQNDMFEAMALYSETLYSLDRLTCGAITKYLGDMTGDLSAAEGGESYVSAEYAEGAHYYIRPIIQSEQFQLGVTIPDGFEVPVTDFELWVNGTQVGERTDVKKSIRHLLLSVENANDTFIRFYNGDSFVDDVKIDASAYSGPLKIVAAYVDNSGGGTKVGTYIMTKNEKTGFVNIELSCNPSEGIEYYQIVDSKGKALTGKELKPVGQKFQYLPLLGESLGEVKIEFYSKDKAKLFTGRFNTKDMTLVRKKGN